MGLFVGVEDYIAVHTGALTRYVMSAFWGGSFAEMDLHEVYALLPP
jgi:hypothetical protein